MQKVGKIRIKDIAIEANVSTGTVDRVLHKRGDVKEGTRKKIMTIVEKMGYTPNLIAQSLASKKTIRIAALLPSSKDNNPYWEMPLEGIQKGADEIKDFNTHVETFTFFATDKNSFIKAYNKALDMQPDGVVLDPVCKVPSIDFIKILDSRKIPYIYFDTDIEIGNNLAYFGQDAKQSGIVAAKILNKTLKSNPIVLIVKLANKKNISHHLRKREEGFVSFFKENNIDCSIKSVEIDLLEKNEPSHTLVEVFKESPEISAVFVPSSRVFKVANFLKNNNKTDLTLIGYDDITENINLLRTKVIDYLICQKTMQQSYMSIMALFRHLISKKEIQKINYSPIDIIVNENYIYYK